MKMAHMSRGFSCVRGCPIFPTRPGSIFTVQKDFMFSYKVTSSLIEDSRVMEISIPGTVLYSGFKQSQYGAIHWNVLDDYSE